MEKPLSSLLKLPVVKNEFALLLYSIPTPLHAMGEKSWKVKAQRPWMRRTPNPRSTTTLWSRERESWEVEEDSHNERRQRGRRRRACVRVSPCKGEGEKWLRKARMQAPGQRPSGGGGEGHGMVINFPTVPAPRGCRAAAGRREARLSGLRPARPRTEMTAADSDCDSATALQEGWPRRRCLLPSCAAETSTRGWPKAQGRYA